jgi:hypothetical protein
VTTVARQARTGPGRRSPLPAAGYQPPPPARRGAGGPEVAFTGDDGRRRVFRFTGLPVAGWHEPLAAAFAARTGPAGQLRTLASALSAWGVLCRFLRFLVAQRPVPGDPARLRAAHLDRFRAHRAATVTPAGTLREMRQLLALLGQEPLRGSLAGEVADYLGRRWKDPRQPGRPGYSDGELARILAAARSDAVAACRRIEAAERLLHRYQHAPAALSETERAAGAELAAMDATGLVPGGRSRSARRQLARQLFLTDEDLPPLLVLMVALTGRNGETVKELPAAHRLLDGKAVEVEVIKRRRGAGRWTGQAAWEIGPPSRRLHTPGGFYLLAHQLTARGRRISGSPSLWPVWRSSPGNTPCTAEHHDPFASWLGQPVSLGGWAQRHDLRGDDGNPLAVQLGRLRTSAEVRRTRQLGGHLPSAARTNTMQVLWNSYLRADPLVTAWAEEVVHAAVGDAEQAALDAHARALAAHGGTLRIIARPAPEPGTDGTGMDAVTAQRAASSELDTAWAGCTDRDASPWNEGTCRASFLDCFHCGNALITPSHLPRLLSLTDDLEQRREQMSEQAWWRRYGPAWAAIRHDVLPEFTPAQVQAAVAVKPADSWLDLAEGLREQP